MQKTLTQMLQESAQTSAQKTALIFNEKFWTYQDLWQQSLSLAKAFQNSGIQAGDKVALFHKNSPHYILTIFALSHLGACAVPINFYQKPQEVAFICQNSQAVGFVYQSAFNSIAQYLKENSSVQHFWQTDSAEFDQILSTPATNFSLKSFNAQDNILILYTSGTTGQSKGVMLTHDNLLFDAAAAQQTLGLNSRDRFLCILPMFHVFAWTANVLIPLSLGCLIVIVESIRPPKPWLSLMAKHGITIFAAVPQIYALLSAQATGIKKWVLRFYFFRKVRMAISGAAPLSAETLELFESRFNVPLLEGYGLTETSPVTHVNTLSARKAGSVGRPLFGVEHKIIDEQGNSLGQNIEGEICLRGANVTQGYYNLPQETQEAFTDDGWFKTGDVGLIDSENFLFIKDRIKDMIIVKGLKVFSVQVEEIFLAHAAVEECAVVGIANEGGDETIHAFIVLKQGQTIEKQELQKLAQEKLPPYKRPRTITFLQELPKNALQKVLKRELRKIKISELDK